jgi:general secretion pathway protein G
MSTRREAAGSLGFTLIEILIAIAIVGVLTTIGIQSYANYRERMRVNQAEMEISVMSVVIMAYIQDASSPPDSLAQVSAAGKLDPWGRPYEYYNLTAKKGNGQARKDKNLNPLNSDFDLYSVGKDGMTSSSLMVKTSRDDVIRASDGRFIGLAKDFDP